MVSYTTDLTSTLFFLHDHSLYFTAADVLTSGQHDHAIPALTPTIIIILCSYIFKHMGIIIVMHANSYQRNGEQMCGYWVF